MPAWLHASLAAWPFEEDLADLLAASPAIAFLPEWELSAAAVHGLLRGGPQHQAG
jgi:hypothetical protein